MEGPLVLVEHGKLRGDIKDGVAHFLNVPYSRAPVGALRWKPPQPLQPWSETRKNPATLSKCPQPAIPFDFEGPPPEGHTWEESEDCLVLNVCVPEVALKKKDSGLPVVFYIHGGAGKLGSCHPDGLSGHDLAKDQNICYVAANYRLGVFGFLAHPELSAEDEASTDSRKGSGNYGILDLISALEWTKENIQEFGGNPNNVTIWGLSTGSQFVGCLLLCPMARGLFHKAVMQSCVDLGNVRKLKSGSDIWLRKSAEEWGCAVGEELGCPQGIGQLEKMRSISSTAIAAGSWSKATTDCYIPATDRREGSSRMLAALEALHAGEINRVPLMIGSTEQDGLGKMELEHTMFEESDVASIQQLETLFEREFGTAKEEAKLHYPHYPHAGRPISAEADVEQALSDLSKDIWYDAGSWIMADKVSSIADAPPVFVYMFTEKVSFTGKPPRSSHGADQRFWNGRKPPAKASTEGEPMSHTDPRNTKLGSTMMAYLCNFARSGNPNGPELPAWDAHRSGSPRCMELGPGLAMMEISQEARARYDFLAREYFEKGVISQLAF